MHRKESRLRPAGGRLNTPIFIAGRAAVGPKWRAGLWAQSGVPACDVRVRVFACVRVRSHACVGVGNFAESRGGWAGVGLRRKAGSVASSRSRREHFKGELDVTFGLREEVDGGELRK